MRIGYADPPYPGQSKRHCKGLSGAKPPAVCRWAFEVVGAEPGDELVDMFPGTGIVGRAWRDWCGEFADCPTDSLFAEEAS